MIQKILLSFLIGSALYGGTATTTTSIVHDTNPVTNKYGNKVYTETVTIKTKDYKVDNFWKKFSFGSKGQDSMNFKNISKTGTVQVSVEATSLCSLYSKLDDKGCSGQKPFLINNTGKVKALNANETITLRFQKDYTGSILDYNALDDTVFYPLDVARTDKYYKNTTSDHKFNDFFGKLFSSFFQNSFFGSFFNYGVVSESNSDSNATDYRQRYIANISAGIDQSHLMKSSETQLLFPSNKATDQDVVSMIDYSETTSNPGNCRLFLFKFDANNGFCNFMGGLPFLSLFSSNRPNAIYTTDTIQEDTQNSLVSLAGVNAKINVTKYKNNVLYQNQATSPIASFFAAIKCLFFGCSNSIVEPATDITYNFTDDNAMTLTMALTDSNSIGKISGFKTFKLMAIHNIASRERQCKVQYSGGFLGGLSWEYTFTPSDGNTVTVGSGWSKQIIDNSDITIENNNYKNYLEWCDAVASKAVIDKSSGFISSFIFGGGYTVVESNYVNSSKKALLLDLKLIELKPTDKSVKLRYKLMNTK